MCGNMEIVVPQKRSREMLLLIVFHFISHFFMGRFLDIFIKEQKVEIEQQFLPNESTKEKEISFNEKDNTFYEIKIGLISIKRKKNIKVYSDFRIMIKNATWMH